MSMTRKEAADIIENKIQIDVRLCTDEEVDQYQDALYMALSALRPVSREQVEKVWRGEWIHKRSPYDYKIFVCKKCGKQISIQGENMDFCPACGAAQTDEAVEMVMERLEVLYEQKV